MIAMNRSIFEHLMSDLPETKHAKEFFTTVGERYMVFNKTEVVGLLNELMSIKYDYIGGIGEHILKIVHGQTKPKAYS